MCEQAVEQHRVACMRGERQHDWDRSVAVRQFFTQPFLAYPIEGPGRDRVHVVAALDGGDLYAGPEQGERYLVGEIECTEVQQLAVVWTEPEKSAMGAPDKPRVEAQLASTRSFR